jgi:hypothetical protein
MSDSRLGFNKAANPDVALAFKVPVDKINALSTPPDQILKSASAKGVFFVPGEHDAVEDDVQ